MSYEESVREMGALSKAGEENEMDCKITKEWREVYDSYTSLTGFDITRESEVEDGSITAREAWDSELKWFDNVHTEVVNIRTPFEDEEG